MPQPETPTQHPRAILIALMFHRICLALYVHLVNRFHILIFDGWSCQRKFVFFWRWLNRAARLTAGPCGWRRGHRVAWRQHLTLEHLPPRQGKTVGTRQRIKVPVRAGGRPHDQDRVPARQPETPAERWLCPHYRATTCPRAVPRRLTGDRPALMPPMLP